MTRPGALAARRPAWQEPARLPTRVGRGAALVVVVILIIVPFLVVVSTSIASPQEVTANGGWVLFPSHPTLSAYKVIFEGGIVTHALAVSVGITLAGTALSLVTTVLLAYALSKPGVLGGRPILVLILFTFLFPPGFVPLFLVVKAVGLVNSYASLILPVLVNVFNLVVMRGFFQGLPRELMDAAHLDGCGEIRTLQRIVLPLSKPVVAVIGLFYAVSYWNSWFSALLYLEDSSKWPLQLVLQTYVTSGGMLADPSAQSIGEFTSAPQTIQMAVVVAAVVPILLVYPFLQRYFVRGVMTGAIKS